MAAVAVTEMLESVTELLDARSSATPRKLRKGLLELLDRVGSACEWIDAEWCQAAWRCAREKLERLGSLLVSASDLGGGVSSEEAVSMVSELLGCVGECGSVAVQAVSGLRGAAAGVWEVMMHVWVHLRCFGVCRLSDRGGCRARRFWQRSL